jgi:biopolymer transport protein ExbB
MRAWPTIAPLLIVLCWTSQAAAQGEPAPEPEAVSEAEPAPVQLEVPQPTSLDELLEMVRKGFNEEREGNRRREQEFLEAKEDQQRLLDETLAVLAGEEALSQRMEDRYNENEPTIALAEEQLSARLGELGELFGVVRQVATDLSGQIWDSLTSSQLGPRTDLLDRLGRSKELPSTADLEKLWFELQREMTEQGKIVRYRTKVLTLAGEQEEAEVIRAGPFSVIGNGKYLLWDSKDQLLGEMERQPPTRYLDTVPAFERAESGFAALAVDPSRGTLLSMLTDTPSRTERVQQGGPVGAVIIILGVLAALIGVWRWGVIVVTSRKVAAQRKTSDVDRGNPLGRILAVYQESRDSGTETLELKLDEAVLRESSKIEQFLWLVKTVSVIAPLLGLLGTVTGMIQTFQAITLFGAGDPKMMAGGISEALVTTMLGLMTAIPLVLLHATLSNSTRRISDVLEEQSAGLVATHSEMIDAGT